MRLLENSLFVLAAALSVAVGLGTISRTEKQLARVDSFDSPDIPAVGERPPLRPRQVGLTYSPNTLIVYYDDGVDNEPLRKAVAKYKADVVYDYSLVGALAVRIPDDRTLEEATRYFRKVKGVVEVSRNDVRDLVR